MMTFLAVLVYVGTKAGSALAEAFRPLWRAWDWITGRRTADLAVVFWTSAMVWDAQRSIVKGDHFGFVFGAAIGIYIGSFIHRVRRSSPAEVSETVPVEAFLDRFSLLVMAGATAAALVPFLVPSILGKSGWGTHGVTSLFIMAELAGAVDCVGGGKSCLRRAAERTAEMLDSLNPMPARVGA